MFLLEVPPLVPIGVAAPEALAALGVLCALIFARGLLSMVDAFVRALFGTAESAVGWIPFAGKVVKWPLHKIEQKISNVLGAAINRVDSYIGHSWHLLARVVRFVGREIESLARLSWAITKEIAHFHPLSVILRHVKALLHPLRTAQHILAALYRALHTAQALLHHAYADILLPRVHGAEHAIEGVIYPDLAALRRRTKSLEREYERLHKLLGRHSRLLAATAFAGATAVALRRLGLGWLRCRNVKRVGRHICELPVGLLEHLLGFAAEVYLIRDLCAFIPRLERLAITFEPALLDLVNEVEGFVCGGKASAPSAIVASDWRRVSELPSAL